MRVHLMNVFLTSSETITVDVLAPQHLTVLDEGLTDFCNFMNGC